jgi:hypothetical protein
MTATTLETHTTPRRHLLYRASTPGRPLIAALGGFTHRVDPPGARGGIVIGQFNANFVDESELLKLAEANDVNVVFISSAGGSWRPWWRRNWNDRDLADAITIVTKACRVCDPDPFAIFGWGFSDGATFVHQLAWGIRFRAIVAHSGLEPARLAPCPCLLVCGSEDRYVNRYQENCGGSRAPGMSGS